MTATTVERNTQERIGSVLAVPVKASTKCLKGTLAVLNAGYAAPATTATGLIALGRFKDTYDNTAGADGAITAEIEQGTFAWANSAAGDLIAQADVGAVCYAVDNQTVAKTNGTSTRSAAGKVVAVDSFGVWVASGLDI